MKLVFLDSRGNDLDAAARVGSANICGPVTQIIIDLDSVGEVGTHVPAVMVVPTRTMINQVGLGMYRIGGSIGYTDLPKDKWAWASAGLELAAEKFAPILSEESRQAEAALMYWIYGGDSREGLIGDAEILAELILTLWPFWQSDEFAKVRKLTETAERLQTIVDAGYNKHLTEANLKQICSRMGLVNRRQE